MRKPPGVGGAAASSVLEALCRSALRLLEAAPQAPARLRLAAGPVSLEMEWPAAGAVAPGAAQPAAAAAVAHAAAGHDRAGGGLAGPPNGQAVNGADIAARATAITAAAGGAVTVAEPALAGHFTICAPTVGTFYHASEPGAEPFVRAGGTVNAGQQVGILEVMKLMTPVEADRPGRVVEILVPDATPVEHGQPLITCAAS